MTGTVIRLERECLKAHGLTPSLCPQNTATKNVLYIRVDRVDVKCLKPTTDELSVSSTGEKKTYGLLWHVYNNDDVCVMMSSQ